MSLAICEQAWTRKRLWYDVTSEAYYYAAPGLDPYLEGSGDPTLMEIVPGFRRQDHLFDGTLPADTEDAVNEMCAETFPAGRDWAELRMGPSLADETVAPARQREALQKAGRKIWSALHASNFYLALNTMGMDTYIAGTGLMKGGIARDSATLLEFEAVSQASIALEPGTRGMIGGFHRKMDLTRDDIRVYWPDASPLPDKDRDVEKDGRPRRYRVIETVYYDIDDGLWRESIILRNQGRGTGDEEIFEREYMVCPWICWRYALLAGEVQGRGPVFKAVPSARTINHAKRVRLETASIRAVPAYTFVGEDVFNPATVEIGPGVFIPVGSNDPQNPTIRALEMAGDVPLNELVIEDERTSIHHIMNRNAMPDPAGPVRSPTEWLKRDEQHLKNKGGPVLRAMEEVGRPVLRLVAYLLQEAGQLKELVGLGRTDENGRPVPLRMDGTDVELVFANPLMQLQDISDALQVFQWSSSCMSSFGPEATMGGARLENGPEVTGKKMKIPEEMIRGDEDDPQEREQMLQQAMAGGSQAGGMAPQAATGG